MAYFLCVLRLAPDYENIEIGIGNEILMKAISKVLLYLIFCEASGRSVG
jgi:hypothetical protein